MEICGCFKCDVLVRLKTLALYTKKHPVTSNTIKCKVALNAHESEYVVVPRGNSKL